MGELTNKDFDKKFPLDRIYKNEYFNFRKIIRFVSNPSKTDIIVYIDNKHISNILITTEGKKVFYSNCRKIVTIDEINKMKKILDRNKKIKKIQKHI